MPVVMTAEDLSRFMKEVFAQVADDFAIDEVGEGSLTMRLLTQDRHLRPGGTISGPSMFALADVSAYLATLAMIGPQALAVTTNCSIDFMRKPQAGVDLIANARLLKLGKLLSVTDVMLHSVGMDAPVARATLTYAIPPRKDV
ncbi:Thioesterase superfamily protein [Sulfitobacter sp. THAF37]|uniref:PaaI family thioesterase n=1 Tax=Sulfitobacter sp. THAF37 TaxID=2587855 RepID=UPI001269463C|nr:PaaI family thioesterase [Sulfitobacter sp. THAF37]QFT60047.1 Thioesterase superfamily protein [Sulfitobacter sp. THAF37]